MYINDVTNLDGLYQEADDICKSDTTTYPIAKKARRLNSGLDRFTYLGITCDGRWSIEDYNRADLSAAITNIVSGQQDYGISVDFLEIEKILAKDNAGNWVTLKIVDHTDSTARDIWELPAGNSGSPTRCDVFANSILLDSIPNYNSTGGLKVVYKRKMVKVTTADTLTRLGTPEIFDTYFARMIALPYLKENKMWDVYKTTKEEIREDEEAVQIFYSKRLDDGNAKVTVRTRSSR
jgi:hypothetical protein